MPAQASRAYEGYQLPMNQSISNAEIAQYTAWLNNCAWAAEFDGMHASRIGIAAITHMLRARRWVHRRVESVSFESDTVATRDVTVDLVVPPRLPLGGTTLSPVSYLPLALFKKRKLRLFHLVDGNSRELPVYTRSARSELAAKGLSAYARGILALHGQSGASTAVEQFLGRVEDIAWASTDDAITIAEAFLPGRVSPDDPKEKQTIAVEEELATSGGFDKESALDYIKTLREDHLFPTIAWNLATHFMLIAPVPWDPESRQRVKFRYEEPVTTEGLKGTLWAFRSLGLFATRVRFPAAAAADARSFHFELGVPDGLQLSTSEFRLQEGTAEGLLVVRGENLDSLPELDPDENPWHDRHKLELVDKEPREGDESKTLSRTHLFRPNIDRNTSGQVWINLRPLSTTLLPAACLTSLLVFVVLLAMAIKRPEAGATSLLLIAPGALSVYVARPSENPLVTRMLLGIRGVVTAAGMLSFAGAVLLTFECSGWASAMIWWLLAAGSGACVGLLVAAFLLSHRRFRNWAADRIPFPSAEVKQSTI